MKTTWPDIADPVGSLSARFLFYLKRHFHLRCLDHDFYFSGNVILHHTIAMRLMAAPNQQTPVQP
jgi:hypothetical protein